MKTSENFFISNETHEIQGVTIGGRRWLIGSSLGRAVELKEPKSFAKGLLRKSIMQAWKESFVVDGIALNRDDQLYAIQRRVLSVELAVFVTAHMRLSELQISVFRLLMHIHQLGFDLSEEKHSMDDFKRDSATHGITIS